MDGTETQRVHVHDYSCPGRCCSNPPPSHFWAAGYRTRRTVEACKRERNHQVSETYALATQAQHLQQATKHQRRARIVVLSNNLLPAGGGVGQGERRAEGRPTQQQRQQGQHNSPDTSPLPQGQPRTQTGTHAPAPGPVSPARLLPQKNQAYSSARDGRSALRRGGGGGRRK